MKRGREAKGPPGSAYQTASFDYLVLLFNRSFVFNFDDNDVGAENETAILANVRVC